jgi:hypothetical protein
MLKQTKIQIEPENYYFIKNSFRYLNYNSMSEYVREAVNAKVHEDRRKIRELKRTQAMEMIGKTTYKNLFESIEGKDFESR